ncbi:hypothetical protein FNV43_RR12948 [Rhamnella rubrinervis]|uniref:Uncharacterized protein n=1 Tax=Rhamnella rubrinervis TaxID=2594499 RepID=A0A8K0H053_9ROSA|nr:hypothetical protein FNV43_RR12948 [Rhamnella rubrinervis]
MLFVTWGKSNILLIFGRHFNCHAIMADAWSDMPELKRHVTSRPFIQISDFDRNLSSDSNPLVFKSFTNSYLAPMMESPGSDLVVEEQLVRKNSNRGANSLAGTPCPRQADEPDVETLIRTPSGQLMPNNWRYLLGLIVQSEKCGLQIDMATFLYFFYMKPSEEGRYTLYARRRIRLFEDAPTSDKGWKDRYFFVKREGLCDPVGTSESGIRSAWTERASNLSERLRITAKQKNVIRTLLRTKTKSLLSILSEDSFRSARLLYGMATDPLWASYPAADMGKLKMKISKAELEATKKKKRDKQALQCRVVRLPKRIKARNVQPLRSLSSLVPYQSPSLIGDSPPSKRSRRSSPPAPAQDKGKKNQTPSMLGLEDSSTISSDSSMVGPVVDSLMTRHDRSLLREITLDEVGLEAEQNALKLAQNARYLYDVVIKLLKRSGGESGRGRPKDRKGEGGSHRARLRPSHWERDALQARVARWPRSKKHIYKKAAINIILKNTNDMIRPFKAGQTEDWVTPDPSDEEEDAPKLNVELNQATSNDSFEKAMKLPSNEESSPGQTSHAADANAGAQD